MKIGISTRNRAKRVLREGRFYAPANVLMTLNEVMQRNGITGTEKTLKYDDSKRSSWWQAIDEGLDLCVMLALTVCSTPDKDVAYDGVDMRADLFEVYGMLEEANTNLLCQCDDSVAWWMGLACRRLQYLLKKYKLRKIYKPVKPKAAKAAKEGSRGK